MINRQLTHPNSIVVVGGSNDIRKPGGKILKNLLDGDFKGELMVMNPKETEVQGVKSYPTPESLPEVDLAIMAIAAKYIPEVVEYLTEHNQTRAFIVLSAGFSEESEAGRALEERMVKAIDKVEGSLIGPNCVGIMTPQHRSIFTEPIPTLSAGGCDFISGSGATACFIMEAGIPNGLQFAHVYSVGNSAQIGVEDILKHMDEHFDPDHDPRVKLLYLENIDKPDMLLKHASSLIRKGCRIAAVKAGSSAAGSRAASSHTGALASPDGAVDALFRKAGIVRCYGREDLISVASVFSYPALKGKRIAVITHAGGPAVMLTDALSNGGLEVPAITGQKAEELKLKLFPGSSVANPIDFLATGTAEQLGIIIDAVNDDFEDIDAMVVIFGTPGLFPIFDVYHLLQDKMKASRKPIFPVLPSVLTAGEEVSAFVKRGGVFFPDEVTLGQALVRTHFAPAPVDVPAPVRIDKETIRQVVDHAPDGYLPPEKIQQLLDAAGIKRAAEVTLSDINLLNDAIVKVGFPLVMKVVGPVHKSDVGGVTLNIRSEDLAMSEMKRMLQIPDATAVLLQPMLSGTELFAGVKKEDKFGHLLLLGLGGIFVEVLKDVQQLLVPVAEQEVWTALHRLRGFKLLEGVRGQEGVDLRAYVDTIVRLSALVEAAPEISEMDLNPLLGNASGVVAVDARIAIKRNVG